LFSVSTKARQKVGRGSSSPTPAKEKPQQGKVIAVGKGKRSRKTTAVSPST
jgi:co-chaperonin GroES (HSP10)